MNEKDFHYIVTLKDGAGVFQGVMEQIIDFYSPGQADQTGYILVYVKSRINLEELLNISPDVFSYEELGVDQENGDRRQ